MVSRCRHGRSVFIGNLEIELFHGCFSIVHIPPPRHHPSKALSILILIFVQRFCTPCQSFFLWISTVPFKSHVFIGHPLSGKGSINIQKVIVAATVGWKSNFRGRKKFEWRSNHVDIMLNLVSSRYEICSWAGLSTRVLTNQLILFKGTLNLPGRFK